MIRVAVVIAGAIGGAIAGMVTYILWRERGITQGSNELSSDDDEWVYVGATTDPYRIILGETYLPFERRVRRDSTSARP